MTSFVRCTEDLDLHPYYFCIDGFTEDTYKFRKGTIFQTSLTESLIHLDDDGDGFLYLPVDKLEEVEIDENKSDFNNVIFQG